MKTWQKIAWFVAGALFVVTLQAVIVIVAVERGVI